MKSVNFHLRPSGQFLKGWGRLGSGNRNKVFEREKWGQFFIVDKQCKNVLNP